MTTRYLVKFRVLPAGVGPDDYEPGDLPPAREETFELSDPEPAGTVAGKELTYGPPKPELEAAVQSRLSEGEQPIILGCVLA